jgi:hypothetical protein
MTQPNNELEKLDGVAAIGDGAESGEDLGEALVPEQPRSNGKSAAILLVLVLAGAAAVYLVRTRGGPAAAAAASSENARATITEFLTDGGRNLQKMRDLLRNTERLVGQFAAFPGQTQVPLKDLRTNPFRFAAPPAPSTGNESEAMAKARHEADRRAALTAVQGLKLQSVMYGQASRACMVNGALYTEGQVIEEISIEQITPNSIIVKMRGFRFEVKIQR